jgi:transcriptional regulator with XRE-family HTH domain
MDYKEEIGRRIRRAREDKGWTLADLALETGDILTLKRISAYENADRMPGPAEAVILAKALGLRSAYIMAVDDRQLPITPQEETMIRNWRTLNERDRMEMFRKIEIMSVQNRDPVSDQAVERHIPMPASETRQPKTIAAKRVKK